MNDWSYVRIGDVLKTTAGGTPLKSKKEFYEGGTVPWLNSGEVRQLEITNSNKFITSLGLKNSSAKIFPPETVLFALYGATAGQVGVLKFEAATNQAICGILPSDEFDAKFLCYCLRSQYEQVVAQAVGNAQPNLSQKKVRELSVPMLPKAEQKRIVSILDEAFGAIERAKRIAEKNLANARELFESYLNRVFTEKGEGWEEKTLDTLCERITKGSSPKWQGFKYVDEPGVLFVTSENVGNNQMIFDKTKYVEEAFNEKDKRSILKRGDVLTNLVGASIGRTAVFNRDDVANINQAVGILRCIPDEVLNHYLSYLLNSPYFKQMLHDNEVDNARANLSLGFFKQLQIPVPSLDEQHRLIATFDEFRQLSKRLELVAQGKLTALDELKQSILQKAFTGKLTAKSPELEAVG